MLIIPLNHNSLLSLLHNSKLAYCVVFSFIVAIFPQYTQSLVLYSSLFKGKPHTFPTFLSMIGKVVAFNGTEGNNADVSTLEIAFAGVICISYRSALVCSLTFLPRRYRLAICIVNVWR